MQLLCGFLKQQPAALGYQPFAVPEDCKLTVYGTEQQVVDLSGFKLLARTAEVQRLVCTATARGGPFGDKGKEVVVKVGKREQIVAEVGRVVGWVHEQLAWR